MAVTTDPKSRRDELSNPPSHLSPPLGTLTFAQPVPDPLGTETDPGSPSLAGEPRDELPDPSEDGPRSSTGSSNGSVISRRVLRDAVRAGVTGAGGAAHQLLARDQVDVDLELYVVDADDAEAIADPLASILQRRGGLGAAGNPDLADAIACLIGLALYASKQIAKMMAAKDYRQRLATGGVASSPAQDPAGDSPPAESQARQWPPVSSGTGE